jgi:Ca2+-binding RTX toxin-like protein
MDKIKKYKRILTLVLLPFVIAGIVYIFNHKKAAEATACDLLKITYNGDSPPDPIFILDDMKPGDVYQKCFKVKNVNTTDSFDVLMRGKETLEEKNFADVLEIIINKSGGSDIYGGSAGFKTVQNFFNEPNPIDLGGFSPGNENIYCITVKFPPEAGNEYQMAKLVFNIFWSTGISESKIPPECKFMTITRIIEGTDGDDNIHGSTASELILGKGGNDKIRASSGNDCIVGGDGNDYLEGESGNDVILGGEGNDHIDAGYGNDIVYGGGGNDKINTGSGQDLVYGGDGNDNIDLGSDNDKAYGEAGNDNIDGGDGNDEIWGGDGNDVLRGGVGNDKLYGEAGNDTIHGNSGDDFLDGGADTDNLHGNTGTDTCVNGEVKASCEL